MFNISKISKHLIVVSAISTLLVFWLGSRFISEALTQYSGATNLQKMSAPEKALLQSAESFAVDRAALQRIMVVNDQDFDLVDRYDQHFRQSELLLREAFVKLDNTYGNIASSFSNTTTDSQATIDTLVSRLHENIERFYSASSIIYAETSLPSSQRNDETRLKLFDAQSNIIADINYLRSLIQFLPEKNYKEVISSHKLKRSIWTLSEGIDQSSSLLETYLIKAKYNADTNINQETFRLRLFQQGEIIEQSMLELRQHYTKAHSDDQSVAHIEDGLAKVRELDAYYHSVFQPKASSMMNSIRNGTAPSIGGLEWAEATLVVQEKMLGIADNALEQTISSADSIIKQTALALFINTVLVLLCFGMAMMAFSLSKNVQHQAEHDDLTQIANRRKFSQTIAEKFKKSGESEKIVLITLDLDGFKAVNDTMGHGIGDRLLLLVAKRLTNALEHDMTLARMGGDEFSILFGTTDETLPAQFSAKLKALFEESFIIDDSSVKIDTSIGYSVYPDDASTPEQLQVASDFAMFHAKQGGGKQVAAYDKQMAEQFEYRATMEKQLVTAIAEEQMELHYQPQFNLSANRVDAVEALIRWNHPSRGMVPPFEFVQVAEETGLMPAMGAWVLNEACRQSAVWNNENKLSIRVAVNVSVHQIMQADFVESVFSALDSHSLESRFLELEVTESVVIADVDWVIESLNKLKQRGIRIALDDFGTGYSSLSQLHELPLDTLKIDRSFINKLNAQNDSALSVTASIASIASVYGLETVAEGVESNSQLHEVEHLGIDVVQGYYYSKPVASADVISTIEQINSDASDPQNNAA